MICSFESGYVFELRLTEERFFDSGKCNHDKLNFS